MRSQGERVASRAAPAPLAVVDELTRLRRALDRTMTRSDRATAANRLFLHAHGLWQAGSLSATEYRLVLAEVDGAPETPEAPPLRKTRSR
jgi:hypothetical protein